ncbi:MAG: dihydrolipoyl dehydrogenase [Oscillospiraceae bacterium]|nr:dihydrolipoyl dehydrogenase [Oscillospiraceae bacterium]
MEKQFDLIVIGAGTGGYTAAICAAREGYSVCILEPREAGGTCLNRGCIPTKTLMHSAQLYRELREAEKFGISAAEVTLDTERLYARKDEVVSQLRAGIEGLLKANKVEYIAEKGEITDIHGDIKTVKTASYVLKAPKILVATGSKPFVPPIPGTDLPGVVTSDEILSWKGGLPASLAIIGGGVIGVEIATIFSDLGKRVVLIEALERLLPGMDREISQNLSMILKRRGVEIFTSATVESIIKLQNNYVNLESDGAEGENVHETLQIDLKRKGEQVGVQAGLVLVAVGRRGYLEGLFAEGQQPESDRGLVVDEYFETSVPGVYAVGDIVSGGIQLAHMAGAQAHNAVAHMVGKEPELDLGVVPSCVYTNPEIAAVGLSEAQAKELGIKVRVGKYPMSGNGKTVIQGGERGFIKLVFDADSTVLLGAQLMCERATDLVSELATAIVNKLTAKQLERVIRPHPTFSEAVSEAAAGGFGKSIYIK